MLTLMTILVQNALMFCLWLMSSAQEPQQFMRFPIVFSPLDVRAFAADVDVPAMYSVRAIASAAL